MGLPIVNVTGTKSKLVNWLKNVHHQGETIEEIKSIYSELNN